MAKNNRWKTGGNKRVAFRNEQRKTGAGVRVYFGRQAFGVGTVRSLNTLLKPFKQGREKQYQKIMREWAKVRKRMEALIKEGYTFTGRLQDIYNGFLHNTKRELEFLKQMTKSELRVLSASYKGIFDTTEKMNLLKQERAAKAAETRRKKREAQEILEQQRITDDIALEDLDDVMQPIYSDRMKIQNIIGEEEDYIRECWEWYGYVDDDRRTACMDIAAHINQALNKMSDEDIAAIIDFWENTGGLYEIIKQGENLYYGMFYDAAMFNTQLLSLTGLTGRELEAIAYNPDAISAAAYHYSPASADFDVSEGEAYYLRS